MNKLEAELEKDPAGAPERLRSLWRSFKSSEHFDLVCLILDRIEKHAFDAIRSRPSGVAAEVLVAPYVVSQIRRAFALLDHDRPEDQQDNSSWSP